MIITCPYCNTDSTYDDKSGAFKIDCPDCHKPFMVDVVIKYDINVFINPAFADKKPTHAPVIKTEESKPKTVKNRPVRPTMTISPEVIKTIYNYMKDNGLTVQKLHQKHFKDVMHRSTFYGLLKTGSGSKDKMKHILEFYQEITPVGICTDARS